MQKQNKHRQTQTSNNQVVTGISLSFQGQCKYKDIYTKIRKSYLLVKYVLHSLMTLGKKICIFCSEASIVQRGRTRFLTLQTNNVLFSLFFSRRQCFVSQSHVLT